MPAEMRPQIYASLVSRCIQIATPLDRYNEHLARIEAKRTTGSGKLPTDTLALHEKSYFKEPPASAYDAAADEPIDEEEEVENEGFGRA